MALSAESVAFGWPRKKCVRGGSCRLSGRAAGRGLSRVARALLTDAPVRRRLVDFSALAVGTRADRAFHRQDGHTPRCAGATLKV